MKLTYRESNFSVSRSVIITPQIISSHLPLKHSVKQEHDYECGNQRQSKSSDSDSEFEEIFNELFWLELEDSPLISPNEAHYYLPGDSHRDFTTNTAVKFAMHYGVVDSYFVRHASAKPSEVSVWNTINNMKLVDDYFWKALLRAEIQEENRIEAKELRKLVFMRIRFLYENAIRLREEGDVERMNRVEGKALTLFLEAELNWGEDDKDVQGALTFRRWYDHPEK